MLIDNTTTTDGIHRDTLQINRIQKKTKKLALKATQV